MDRGILDRPGDSFAEVDCNRDLTGQGGLISQFAVVPLSQALDGLSQAIRLIGSEI